MKKIVSWMLILMLGTILFVGCMPSKEQTPSGTYASDQNSALSGKIVVAGSTSVQSLSEELAAAFMERYPKVSVEVQGGGSSVGVKSAYQKICDIGAVSRELKEEEKGYGLKEYTIAKDGIAIVVHPANKVEDLTLEQIQKIFTGEIKSWKEVGGADKEIVVVSREEGSGTRGAFVEITKVERENAQGKKVDATTSNALVQPSTGAVKNTVANTPDAVGYISLGTMDETIRALKIEGAEATAKNCKSGEYKISRPFNYLTNKEESELVKTYIDFVLNEGQEIVSKEFISIK